jgi:8-oxo-dGTP pyrophosphatase MutT (NUDIX family)
MSAPSSAPSKPKRKPFRGHTRGMIVLRSGGESGAPLAVALAETPSGELGFLKGGVEEGEQGRPKVTAAREVHEEAGLELVELRILPSHEFVERNEKGNVSVACWLAVFVGAPNKPLVSREGDELKRSTWMDVDEALQHACWRAARRNLLRAASEIFTTLNIDSLPLGDAWIQQAAVAQPTIIEYGQFDASRKELEEGAKPDPASASQPGHRRETTRTVEFEPTLCCSNTTSYISHTRLLSISAHAYSTRTLAHTSCHAARLRRQRGQ